ncbi:hypothetical protein MJO29_004718 [Puccinia striiformis f. sp. tritici]|nr:hypothetical protein Pst134EA_033342 [Puccinia striiformis f. sp. tritici]KAH9470531.1 hypothetical protein Pst134EA_033342 [Puccinia striiformis f. sp. tritici]KAI7964291.1 hypothetical protein MJO29_004718 [Puccinia striiformis f. sp. tritici]KAI9625158.1 hypothetical protein KEM48_008558 [Puccinia striiformis f. sp. tritici PST-130]
MFTTIYVASLLAAVAFASPVHHEARGFSSYSQDSAQSARNHDSQASMGPFGGHMSSSDSASSAVSHNSGSNMIGGGLDGFGLGSGLGFGNAGGMSASNSMSSSSRMSASNSLNAGGIGGIGGGAGMIGGAGFGMNQQNSFSTSSAISSFQNVNSMLGQMQSMLMAGSMSQTVAQQSMYQLAQSLQVAMTQATGCMTCFSGQGSQFASVASSTFNQFTSFMSQIQGVFGGNLGPILTPFGSLGQTFQSFFEQASSSTSSSSSFSNMLSPNFAPVMQSIIPGVGGPLSLLGF